MKIASLKIKNFKSFGEEVVALQFNHKLNSFIGLNSSGKTAALEALKKVFGNYSEREIRREDFHIQYNENPDEISEKQLSIEVKIEFETDEESIPLYFSDMVIDEPQALPYVRIKLEATYNINPTSQYGDIDQQIYFVRVAEGEVEQPESVKPYPNFLKNLIELIYVPAIRRPSEQLKFASGSILYRLLRNLDFNDEFKGKFEEEFKQIDTLFKELNGFNTIQTSLATFWQQFHKDERYADANLNFGSSDLDSILKKIEVTFSPTELSRSFYIDDLGDGYRSLFYLTLACSLLDVEEKIKIEDDVEGLKKPLLTLLAIEEPENHIAPQLLGRVINILNKISEKSNTQVFITSHTPTIIKRIEPESIFHFRIDKEYKTQVNKVELPAQEDEAYKYIKEAVQNYPEIYFARLVILGEGDSEEVIFTRLMKVLKTDFDDNIISFAPLGHRFVNHIWKLLNKLKIPYVTLLDLDLEREGGGFGRIKYALKQLIAIGIEKKELLKIDDDNELRDEQFENMHQWDNTDAEALHSWTTLLEQYDVYYSGLLDLDFLMLKKYSDYYTSASSYQGDRGPRIPDKDTKPQEYNAYLNSAIHATLKSDDATGECYTGPEKELMIWYKYHFLGRGKPVTHIQVLSQIPDEEIESNLPIVFSRIFNRINELINL